MADDEAAGIEKCSIRGELEKQCHPACSSLWADYKACADRVAKAQEAGEELHGTCAPQYMDYFTCLDKCVVPQLFKRLK